MTANSGGAVGMPESENLNRNINRNLTFLASQYSDFYRNIECIRIFKILLSGIKIAIAPLFIISIGSLFTASVQSAPTLGLKKKLFDWRNIEKKNRVGRSEIFFFFKSMFHIPEHKIYLW